MKDENCNKYVQLISSKKNNMKCQPLTSTENKEPVQPTNSQPMTHSGIVSSAWHHLLINYTLFLKSISIQLYTVFSQKPWII